jgi:hypothetical protein
MMRRSMASSGSKLRGGRFLRSEGNSTVNSDAWPFSRGTTLRMLPA